MSMNRFMHRRNIYKTPPDFKQLAIEFDDFRNVSKMKPDGTVHIDFSDEKALRTLTECLLKKDFNLDIFLPPNQLVPTLPLRLNYILWIEDIIQSLNFTDVTGVDIGCGASCIYPLLAIKMNSNWYMYATEVNETSVDFARQNISRNGFETRIILVESDDGLSEILNQTDQIHFTMCNPPFFSDEDTSEQSENRTGKRKSANNAKTGIKCELTISGGEVEFVKKMIEQSKTLGNRVKVFTSMLGQKTSVSNIISMLKANKIYNFCTSEFCQGRTTRWGIAWTHDNSLLLRTVPEIGQTFMKTSINMCLDNADRASKESDDLVGIFEGLVNAENKVEKMSKNQFRFLAFNNSWSNQRRRRREQQRNAGSQEAKDDENPTQKRIKLDAPKETDSKEPNNTMPLLHVEVTVEPNPNDRIKEITLKYLNGHSGMNGVHELSQLIQNKWNRSEKDLK